MGALINEEAHILGRIEAKVDILVERSAKHDIAIRGLERKQWFQSGVIAACVAVVVPKLKVLFGL
jgi:hypothetical protein